jgi:hypothetical protein
MTERFQQLLRRGRRSPTIHGTGPPAAGPGVPAVQVPRPTETAPGARRWHAFEARLADGAIKEGVIRLANGDRVTIGPGTPVILGPGDIVAWRERHGWGWSTAEPILPHRQLGRSLRP